MKRDDAAKKAIEHFNNTIDPIWWPVMLETGTKKDLERCKKALEKMAEYCDLIGQLSGKTT